MSVALAAAVGIGVTLGVPLLRAVANWRGLAKRESRDAKRAREQARTERDKASKLRKAVERVRREEAERAKRGASPVSEAKQLPPPAPDEPPLHRVDVKDEPAKPKADTLEKLGQEKPTKKVAAERLLAYVSRSISEGRTANLGTRELPSQQIAEGQRGMGKLTIDGIYGEKTRGRGKELTGKPWPARPKAPAKPTPAATKPAAAKPAPVSKPEPKPAPSAPAASKPATAPAPSPVRPGSRTSEQAAKDLLAFAREAIADGKTSRLGTGAAPSEVVRSAQRDMGGIATDGVYGPATRKRGRELTGTTFPARA